MCSKSFPLSIFFSVVLLPYTLNFVLLLKFYLFSFPPLTQICMQVFRVGFTVQVIIFYLFILSSYSIRIKVLDKIHRMSMQ